MRKESYDRSGIKLQLNIAKGCETNSSVPTDTVPKQELNLRPSADFLRKLVRKYNQSGRVICTDSF